jgi:nitrous oxidase accessory protein NosD
MPGIGSGAGAVSRRFEKELIVFKHISPLAIASALVFRLPCASPANALSAVTFVSGKGTDAGTCASPATPRRTFQFASGQTSPGGEIKALDPADYEPMTITKAISITGVEGAGINRTTAGNAITIKAGSKDVINLTNLTNDGLNTGQTGIELDSFGSLTVTHCMIRKFRGDGIDIFQSSGVKFLIADVVVSDNGGLGLLFVGVPGTVDHVNVYHNGQGVRAAEGAAIVSIVESTVTNNANFGIDSDDGADLRLAQSAVTGNVGGIELTGGTIESAGNNFITDSISGTLTEVGTK